MWNHFPGYFFIRPEFSMFVREFPSAGAAVFSEMSSTSFAWTHFTVIITVGRPAMRASAPLFKLIHELLAHSPVAQIILLWTGLGSPKVSNREGSCLLWGDLFLICVYVCDTIVGLDNSMKGVLYHILFLSVSPQQCSCLYPKNTFL